MKNGKRSRDKKKLAREAQRAGLYLFRGPKFWDFLSMRDGKLALRFFHRTYDWLGYDDSRGRGGPYGALHAAVAIEKKRFGR